LWLGIFVFLPLGLVLAVSFLSRGEYGQVQLPFTLENYRRLAGWTELGFDPLYPRVLLRTLLLSGGVTVLCLAAALPLAFFIAGTRPRLRTYALAMVIVPFWTNLLIRTYAWQILLGAGGPLARAAVSLGWIAPETGLQPGWFAVVLAMFCDFLPFMVLPLYASVERIDWSLAEAAADLGASPWRVFRHSVLPQILPGMGAGTVMVLLPATGQFVIPDLLGGGRVTLLGNLVQQQFGVSRDWPLGAAAAVILILLLLVAMGTGRRRDMGTMPK
jgi:spermidine/putrescine transport system permease protein